MNGASDFRNLYAMGDTVDFQLADANGDLRLSVGPLQIEPGPGIGRYRELTEEELCIMFKMLGMEK